MTSSLESLTRLVQEKYDHEDPSHDFAHIRRVTDTARKLGETLGADLEVVTAAALLHDVINVPKNHPDRSKASAMAAEHAAALLREQGFTEAQIPRITTAILEHSFSAGKAATTLESSILQDADRLEAIGAVGIMRWVACGARMGSRFYHSDDPFGRKGRELDDRRYMLDHCYMKLLLLEARFNTEPAKREAARRTAFLRAFIDQLEHEITFA